MGNKSNYETYLAKADAGAARALAATESPFTIEVPVSRRPDRAAEGCLQGRSGSLGQGDRGRRAKRHGGQRSDR